MWEPRDDYRICMCINPKNLSINFEWFSDIFVKEFYQNILIILEMLNRDSVQIFLLDLFPTIEDLVLEYQELDYFLERVLSHHSVKKFRMPLLSFKDLKSVPETMDEVTSAILVECLKQ